MNNRQADIDLTRLVRLFGARVVREPPTPNCQGCEWWFRPGRFCLIGGPFEQWPPKKAKP